MGITATADGPAHTVVAPYYSTPVGDTGELHQNSFGKNVAQGCLEDPDRAKKSKHHCSDDNWCCSGKTFRI